MSDEEPGDWRNIRVRTTLGVIGSVVVAVAVISWQIFGIRAQIDDNSVAVGSLAAGMGEIREATEAAGRVATAHDGEYLIVKHGQGGGANGAGALSTSGLGQALLIGQYVLLYLQQFLIDFLQRVHTRARRVRRVQSPARTPRSVRPE